MILLKEKLGSLSPMKLKGCCSLSKGLKEMERSMGYTRGEEKIEIMGRFKWRSLERSCSINFSTMELKLSYL